MAQYPMVFETWFLRRAKIIKYIMRFSMLQETYRSRDHGTVGKPTVSQGIARGQLNCMCYYYGQPEYRDSRIACGHPHFPWLVIGAVVG